MTGEIWIPCEGSGGPLNIGVYCKMCGESVPTKPGPTGRVARLHERTDILTMLDQGYFDPQPEEQT